MLITILKLLTAAFEFLVIVLKFKKRPESIDGRKREYDRDYRHRPGDYDEEYEEDDD